MFTSLIVLAAAIGVALSTYTPLGTGMGNGSGVPWYVLYVNLLFLL